MRRSDALVSPPALHAGCETVHEQQRRRRAQEGRHRGTEERGLEAGGRSPVSVPPWAPPTPPVRP